MPLHAGHELAHDFRALGVCEVHVVGDGDRVGADGDEVAPGFDHGLLGAHLWIGRDVSGSDVTRDGEPFLVP